MPRIRTLKPEHRQHRKVGPLSDREYRLWVSMILEAEDAGRLVCDAAQLKAVTWPYHPRVAVAHVEAAIRGLAATGMIRLYTHDGVRYADFPSWTDHQRIDHPAKPKLPEYQPLANPRESSRILANDPGGKEVEVEVEVEGKGMEGNGREARARSSREPSPLLANNNFHVPQSVAAALIRAPRLGSDARLQTPAWWLAEVRANPGVDFAAEVLKAEAWMQANPKRATKRDYSRFLHNWLARADRPEP